MVARYWNNETIAGIFSIAKVLSKKYRKKLPKCIDITASISKNGTTIVTTKGTTTLNNNDNKPAIPGDENQIGEATKENRIVLPMRHATVSYNVLQTAHMNLLHKKTPGQHIHEKPGKGGGKFKYVTGAYVKSQLNRLFGFDWNFTVKSFDVKGNQCIVFGRLEGTIRDKDGKVITTLVREQFGRADIKTLKADKTKALDFGNDLKAATTDALKKCASDLGIARDVYAADEYRELAFYDNDDQQQIEKDKKTAKYEDKITEIDTAVGDLEEITDNDNKGESEPKQ